MGEKDTHLDPFPMRGPAKSDDFIQVLVGTYEDTERLGHSMTPFLRINVGRARSFHLDKRPREVRFILVAQILMTVLVGKGGKIVLGPRTSA